MMKVGESERTLQIIGALKLVKGSFLILTAAGLFSLVHKDQTAVMSRLVQHLGFDTHAHFFRQFAERFLRLSPKLPLLAVGTFGYGVLFVVEGTGLLRKKRWAEYLTVIATASFLPLELYEMLHHPTATKALVMVLNIAILFYLVWKLRQNADKGKNSAHTTQRFVRTEGRSIYWAGKKQKVSLNSDPQALP